MNEFQRMFWSSLLLSFSQYRKLIDYFGSLQNAYKDFSADGLLESGINKRTVTIWLKKQKEFEPKNIENLLKKTSSRILFYEDEGFPQTLKEIDDAPVFLFIKGEILSEDFCSLSVVGSRTVSGEGKYAIENILPDIVNAGMTIVSGMAYGIDTMAHRAALKNGGRTIAFWGTGLDVCYPSANKKLADEIFQNGTIISEFPFGTPPNPYNFPRRNRLVSGFSRGTLVIEGKKKSGSLITAEFALDQSKEVFAVPGPIHSVLSEGPNLLIQSGSAKLVLKSADILEEFHLENIPEERQSFVPENTCQEFIWKSLQNGVRGFDDISESSSFSSAEISSNIMMMILQGYVQEIESMKYVRK